MIAAFFNLILALGIAGVIAYIVFAVLIPSIQRQTKAQEDFDRLKEQQRRDAEVEASMRERAEAELEDEIGPVEVVLGEPNPSTGISGFEDADERPI